MISERRENASAVAGATLDHASSFWPRRIIPLEQAWMALDNLQNHLDRQEQGIVCRHAHEGVARQAVIDLDDQRHDLSRARGVR